MGVYKFFKRFFDILGSLLLILVLSPLFVIVGILIFFKMGSPILFKQNRPGHNESIFEIYKFRTMLNGDLSDDERLTKFGLKLRELSLDELPQLFNILKGDMSFIGPRPLLCEYLPLYDDNQKKRHLIKPGITGLAQVSGRNSLSWDDKFKLDIEYVENVSFMMDIKIAIKTIQKVYYKDGISSSSSKTMERFLGKK